MITREIVGGVLQKFCIVDPFSAKKTTNRPQTKKIYSLGYSLLFDIITIPSSDGESIDTNSSMDTVADSIVSIPHHNTFDT